MNLLQLAYLPGWLATGAAQAQALSATVQFTVPDVRPEAYSWYWDNMDQALQTAANKEVVSFRWIQAPASPQHLGYSTGARYQTTAVLGGLRRSVEVGYLPPHAVRARVASDNFLGDKPYSFVAQSVSIDGQSAFTVLIQYTPTGDTFGDSQFRVDALNASNNVLARLYVNHVAKTLQGLQPALMDALNTRYFNAVLKKRGHYTFGSVDKKFNVTLTVVQEVKGVSPEMLSWWWDHIGNTARYRLWQPIDHVSFEWTVAPSKPDQFYDIGAAQKVKEYIGRWPLTLTITAADPAAPPASPVKIDTPGYFYAHADLTLLAGLLPSNTLLHQWRPNGSGDGIILTSTFVNTALARVINPTFFDDLGAHALREFQMLPYFLPRLYKREALGQ